MEVTKKDKLVATVCLILTAVIWGSGFIANQLSMDAHFSPGLIMLLRFGIATLVLLAIFNKKLFHMSKGDLKHGAIAGGILFLAFYTQTLGLSMTTPSNNGFFTALNVIMVPFIAWFVFKKRPQIKVFFACAACLFGIFVLTYTGSGISFNMGDFLTVVCAFFFACHIAYLGHCSSKVNSTSLTFLQMLFAFALSAIAFVFTFAADPAQLAVIDLGIGLPAIIYLGVMSTCLCFFLQTFAQSKTTSSTAAVILCTESLWCSVFSVIVGFEAASINMVLGGAIILCSVILVEVDIKQLFAKKTIKQ